MKTNKNLPQTDKWENRPEPAADRERITPLAVRPRQMVTQSSQFSHRTPGEIHSNGSMAGSACSQGGSSLMKWNLGHWDMRITRNYSQSQLVTNPNHLRLCLTITHESVSPVTNFYINCHLIEADNLQLYVPGLGETLLTCTLQFTKVWTLAHDNRQREAKQSQIVSLFLK